MMLLIVVTVYVLTLLWWQWRRGVFTPGAFAQAPPREGVLTAADLLVTAGLWLVGPTIVIQLAGALGGFEVDLESPDGLLRVQALSYLGWLPAVVFIAYRAAAAVEGGARAFGFSLRSAGQTVRLTFGTAAFIIPASLLANALVALVARQFGYVAPPVAHEALKVIQTAAPSQQAGFAVMVVLLAPFVEELIFRGMLQTAARQAGLLPGRWVTILVVSALFAVIHVGSVPPIALPGLFALGVGMGYAYEKSGSLIAPMAIHAMFNAFNLGAVLLDLVPGETAAAVGS